MDKNVYWIPKLFVGFHQDCDVILSRVRLLNFFLRLGLTVTKKKEWKSSKGKKSYLNLQPRVGEKTKITVETKFFSFANWVSSVVSWNYDNWEKKSM